MKWRVRSGELDAEVEADGAESAVLCALDLQDTPPELGAIIEISPLRSDILYARTDVILKKLGRWHGPMMEPSDAG